MPAVVEAICCELFICSLFRMVLISQHPFVESNQLKTIVSITLMYFMAKVICEKVIIFEDFKIQHD